MNIDRWEFKRYIKFTDYSEHLQFLSDNNNKQYKAIIKGMDYPKLNYIVIGLYKMVNNEL